MLADFPRLIFFITHSHKDNEFVRRLTDDLYRAGLQGFCDLDAIKPGDNFVDRINQGLESCTIYVPVLSNDVLDSPWCKTEISAALELSHRRGREGCPRIISLLIEDCFDRIPVLLRIRLQIPFLERYEEGLKRLVAAITGEESKTPDAPPEKNGTAEQPSSHQAPQTAQPSQPQLSPPQPSSLQPGPGVDQTPAPIQAEIEPRDRQNAPSQPTPPPKPPPAPKTPPPQDFSFAQPSADLLSQFAEAESRGALDTAITLGERILQLDSTDSSVRRKTAVAYQSRGLIRSNRLDHDRAISDFNRAIELDPSKAELFLARGARFHSRGKYKQAVEDFTRAVQMEPNEASCYFARGRSYHYLDEDNRAVADFDQAVRLAPDEVYSYVARGESLYAMSDYQAATSDFAIALRLNPRAAHYYHYCIGLCLSRQGDYASAAAAFSRAIEHNPNQVHYYIERGRNYRWQGDRDAGEMDYERAMRLDMDRADRYFDNATKDYVLLD
ncbi:MAG: tetratricopeptide repeat protein [Blastocatellia bacterium]